MVRLQPRICWATFLGSDRTHCTAGNLNNHLGVPLSLLGIELNQHKFAVIEAGINGKGEMQELAHMIQPNIVVVTNIGSSHLEGLGSEQGVANEKAHLFKQHPALKKVIFLNIAWRLRNLMNFLKLPMHNVWFFEKGFLRASVGGEVHYNFGLKQTRPGTHLRLGFGVMGSRL